MILTFVLRSSAVLSYNPKEKEESKTQEKYFLYQPGFYQSLCRPSIKKYTENNLDDKQSTLNSDLSNRSNQKKLLQKHQKRKVLFQQKLSKQEECRRVCKKTIKLIKQSTK